MVVKCAVVGAVICFLAAASFIGYLFSVAPGGPGLIELVFLSIPLVAGTVTGAGFGALVGVLIEKSKKDNDR